MILQEVNSDGLFGVSCGGYIFDLGYPDVENYREERLEREILARKEQEMGAEKIHQATGE